MKIAGNKLAHLSDYYHSELDEIVGKDEVNALFRLAVEFYLPVPTAAGRNELHLRLNDRVNQSELLGIYDCCKELKKGRPIQYILGEAWFYGSKFKVNENVLIPRPETEELCELIIKENANCISLLDIGTGSGCIPVSIKKHLPNCEVSALDVSERALEIAKVNAELNGTGINFLKKDILKEYSSEKKFGVIVSNPPYIKKNERSSLAEQVIAHEPHLALFVEGEDDIVFYKRIIDVCKNSLAADGKLYFELNPLTASKVLDYAKAAAIFKSAELIKDMSGNVRFLIAKA
jgi:release factor glutamine methyltransferase